MSTNSSNAQPFTVKVKMTTITCYFILLQLHDTLHTQMSIKAAGHLALI